MNSKKFVWTKKATSILTSMLLLISFMFIVPPTEVKADDTPDIGINTSGQLSAQLTKQGSIYKGQDITLNYSINPYGSVNESRKPVDVVLVIDASGSMLYDKKKEYTMSAAKKFMHTMASSSVPNVVDKAGIVIFAYNAYKTKSLYSIKNNEGWFCSTLESAQWGGCTNMSSGLTGAIDLLKNESGVDKYVILLTDGYPNYVSYGLSRRYYSDYFGSWEVMEGTDLEYDDYGWDAQQEAIARVNTLKSLNAKTYAIGLATNGGDIDSGYINRLASAGGTNGIVTSDVNKLDSIYNNIAKQIISSYQFTNMKITQPVPAGFKVKSLPPGWSQVGNNIVADVPDVSFDNQAATPDAQQYSVVLTANTTGKVSIPDGTLNYDKPDGAPSNGNFKFGSVNVEDVQDPDLSLNVTADKNTCLVGDPVTITATATPIGASYKKAKIKNTVIDQNTTADVQKTMISSNNKFGTINYDPLPNSGAMSVQFKDVFTKANYYGIDNSVSYSIDADTKAKQQKSYVDVRNGVIRVYAKSPTGKGIQGLNVKINGVVQPNKTNSDGYVECNNMKTDNYSVSVEVPNDKVADYNVTTNPQPVNMNYTKNDQTLTFNVDQLSNLAGLTVSNSVSNNKILVGDEITTKITVTPTGSQDGVSISNITVTPKVVPGVKNTDITVPGTGIAKSVNFSPTPDKGTMTNTYITSFNTTGNYSVKYDLDYDIKNGTTVHKTAEITLPQVLVGNGKINVNVSGTKKDNLEVIIDNHKTGIKTQPDGTATISGLNSGSHTVGIDVPSDAKFKVDNNSQTSNAISYDSPTTGITFNVNAIEEKPTISNCSLKDSKGNTNFVLTSGNTATLVAKFSTDKDIHNAGINLNGLGTNLTVQSILKDNVPYAGTDISKLGDISAGDHVITIVLKGITDSTQTSVNAAVTFDKVVYDNNKIVNIDSSMIAPNCTNVVNMVIISKDLRLGFAK